MTNTGYIFVDCGGLEFNEDSAQSISGIYNRAKAALASKKPVYAINCKMNNGYASPISVCAWQENSTTIIATGHVFRVTITNADSVTITNLVSANRAKSR